MFIKFEKVLRVIWIVSVVVFLVLQGTERYESKLKKFGFALEESIQSQSLVRLSGKTKLSDYGSLAHVVEISEYSILRRNDSNEFIIEMRDLLPYSQIMNGREEKTRVIHDSNIYKPWEIFVDARSVDGNLVFGGRYSAYCSIRVSMRNLEFLPTLKAIEATITIVDETNKFDTRSGAASKDCVLRVGQLGKSTLKFGNIDEK